MARELKSTGDFKKKQQNGPFKGHLTYSLKSFLTALLKNGFNFTSNDGEFHRADFFFRLQFFLANVQIYFPRQKATANEAVSFTVAFLKIIFLTVLIYLSNCKSG